MIRTVDELLTACKHNTGEPVGIWIRVSGSKTQDEAFQIPDVGRRCVERNYRVVRRYELHARSAYKGQQQSEIDRMLTDFRTGAITAVVCWRSDRVERRGQGWLLSLLNKIKDAGGRIESIKEPGLGGIEFGDQVMTSLTEIMDNQKSARISDDVLKTFAYMRDSGALTTRTMFGYTSEGPRHNRGLIPHPVWARYVPLIFAKCIEGLSLKKIAAWLDSEGVPVNRRNPDGRRWAETSVKNIINNPTYMGSHSDDNGKVILLCPALVDAATWTAANKALKSHPKRGPAQGNAMLKSAIVCPRCAERGIDSPMYRLKTGGVSGTGKRHGGVMVAYRCAGRGAQRQSCGNMVRLEEADAAVSQMISEEWDVPAKAFKFIPGNSHESRLAEIQYELEHLGLQGLPEEEEDQRRAVLRTERKRLLAEPAEPDRLDWVELSETYAQQWDRLSADERGAWLKANRFVITATKEAVTVTQDGKAVTVILRRPVNEALRPEAARR
jgi:DNA invertase Pin-like site-specific DNA recombinase